MKNLILTTLASIGLLLTVGCGGHGGSSSTPTDTVGITGIYGSQCQPWQIYSPQVNLCLEPGYPVHCRYSNEGYNPADGQCYAGTRGGSGAAVGTWSNGMTVVNQAAFNQLVRDLGLCYNSGWGHRHSGCNTGSWLYIQVTVQNGASPYPNQGFQSQFPGFFGSSAAALGFNNYNGSLNQNAFINLQTGGNSYQNSVTSQFSGRVHSVQGGFEVQVRPTGTSAYRERINYTFTYNDVAANQLHMKMSYKGELLVEGDINRF